MQTKQAYSLRYGVQAIQNAHPLIQIIGASFLIALSAQIHIPLPFTPVPIVLHSLSIMLVGAILGSKKGSLSVLLYLLGAAAGLPVLAGWRIEPLAFFTPVGGYLFGFVAQAYIIGWILEKRQSYSLGTIFMALSIGTIVQLTMGTIGLVPFVGWKNCFIMGFFPFISTEGLKIMAAAAYLRACHRPVKSA